MNKIFYYALFAISLNLTWAPVELVTDQKESPRVGFDKYKEENEGFKKNVENILFQIDNNETKGLLKIFGFVQKFIAKNAFIENSAHCIDKELVKNCIGHNQDKSVSVDFFDLYNTKDFDPSYVQKITDKEFRLEANIFIDSLKNIAFFYMSYNQIFLHKFDLSFEKLDLSLFATSLNWKSYELDEYKKDNENFKRKVEDIVSTLDNANTITKGLAQNFAFVRKMVERNDFINSAKLMQQKYLEEFIIVDMKGQCVGTLNFFDLYNAECFSYDVETITNISKLKVGCEIKHGIVYFVILHVGIDLYKFHISIKEINKALEDKRLESKA